MVQFIIILLAFTSGYIKAVSTEIELRSILIAPDGKRTITFTAKSDQTEKTLIQVGDPSGMGTLALIQFMMIQGVSEKLWEKIKHKTVDGWSDTIHSGVLNSLYTISKTAGDKEYKEAVNLIRFLKAKKSLTYADLNRIGHFIEKYSNERHFLDINNKAIPILGNQMDHNPVGNALGSRSLTLPPQSVSKSPATILGSLETILNSARGEEPGRLKFLGKARKHELFPSQEQNLLHHDFVPTW